MNLQHNNARKFTHKLIAKVAMEIAGEAYDEMARDNLFYQKNPNAQHYVATNWHKYIDAAREALGKMLAMPGIHEDQKEIICDALVCDSALRATAGHRTVH